MTVAHLTGALWVLCTMAAGLATAATPFGDTARDKRAFLEAMSEPGASIKSDNDWLSAMTGATVQPQAKDIPFRGVPTRHEASGGFLSHDRLLSSYSYVYASGEGGQYSAILRFRLDSRFACLTMDDLTDVLGKPARLPRAPPAAQTGARQMRSTQSNTRCGAGRARHSFSATHDALLQSTSQSTSAERSQSWASLFRLRSSTVLPRVWSRTGCPMCSSNASSA